MGLTAEHYCPGCDETTAHRLIASTRLHLGVKRKYRCEACDHQVVSIDGSVLPVEG